MSQTEAWTVGRLLKWTTDYLQDHHADSPRLDAEILLAEAMDCQRIELYTAFETVPDEHPRAAFRQLVSRRAEGTPVAYLVGRREFYSMSFRVTPDVLIPRPETEFLIVALLDLVKERSAGEEVTICDVGCGSGIVAVCAAKHLPEARVTALDISPAALEVAADNARQHGVADRIEFVQSDLLTGLPDGQCFDFIASNPPYVSEPEFESLPRDVRDYEPRLALVGGPQGTEVTEKLVAEASSRLRPGGHLLVEINPALHEATTALLAADATLELGPTVKDLAQLPRVVQARKT